MFTKEVLARWFFDRQESHQESDYHDEVCGWPGAASKEGRNSSRHDEYTGGSRKELLTIYWKSTCPNQKWWEYWWKEDVC